MAKNTFYFSHDGNARNDEKILAVRMRLGAEGYAIYFMILEKLLESTNYISIKDYNVLAFDFRVSADKVKIVVEDFGLFELTEDKKHFYSISFLNRMKPLDNLRDQRRLAGLKSAEKRANSTKNQQNSTVVERSLPKNPTKESRVNKSKVNNNINNSVYIENTPKNLNSEITSDFLKNENQNKENKTQGAAKKFINPELSEIEDYFFERGEKEYKTEAEKFYNHYSSNGWKVGRNPMKDWKASVRNWILQSVNFKKNGDKSNTKEPKIGRANQSDLEKLYKQMGGK